MGNKFRATCRLLYLQIIHVEVWGTKEWTGVFLHSCWFVVHSLAYILKSNSLLGFLTTLPLESAPPPSSCPESILTVAVPEPSRMLSRSLLADFEGSSVPGFCPPKQVCNLQHKRQAIYFCMGMSILLI